MDEIQTFDSIKAYNAFCDQKTLHPLVSLVNLNTCEPRLHRKTRYEFYIIFLKEIKCGDLRYGLKNYDYEEGTLIFLGPGQVIGQNNGEYYKPQGTALLFHPDLLAGTPLGKNMDSYRFFSYAANEALHLSAPERKIILDCLDKIAHELQQPIDKHSKQLMVSNLELFLNYCTRFYDRQFITRENVHKGHLEKFEDLLKDYFASDKPQTEGLPSVAYCAEQLNLSANYFGDVVKKESGKSPHEYIQAKVIELAKGRMFDVDKSISEVAYSLGFKYPQHFTRAFKKSTGYTPQEFRLLN